MRIMSVWPSLDLWISLLSQKRWSYCKILPNQHPLHCLIYHGSWNWKLQIWTLSNSGMWCWSFAPTVLLLKRCPIATLYFLELICKNSIWIRAKVNLCCAFFFPFIFDKEQLTHTSRSALYQVIDYHFFLAFLSKDKHNLWSEKYKLWP